MRIGLTCVLFIFGMTIVSAQTPAVKKLSDPRLVHLLNNVSEFKIFSAKDLGISVFVVFNPDGSAHLAESHESTVNIYFAVTEPDLNPRQSLFCIKDLYAVSDFRLEKDMVGEVWISFRHINIANKKNTKKRITIRLSLEKATIMKSAESIN